MTGQMLAFDKHMNLVLADTEEFRRVKRKQNKPSAPGASGSTSTIETEEKRTLGLTIVRGAHIVSLSVESPPPSDPSARLGKSTSGGITSTLQAGPGVLVPPAEARLPLYLVLLWVLVALLLHLALGSLVGSLLLHLAAEVVLHQASLAARLFLLPMCFLVLLVAVRSLLDSLAAIPLLVVSSLLLEDDLSGCIMGFCTFTKTIARRFGSY